MFQSVSMTASRMPHFPAVNNGVQIWINKCWNQITTSSLKSCCYQVKNLVFYFHGRVVPAPTFRNKKFPSSNFIQDLRLIIDWMDNCVSPAHCIKLMCMYQKKSISISILVVVHAIDKIKVITLRPLVWWTMVL